MKAMETQEFGDGPEGTGPSPPTPDASVEPGPVATSRLRRSAHGRMIAGVCSGLAGELRVPVAIVRAAAVLLALTGIGVPLYVLAALFFRDESGERLVDRRGTKEVLVLGCVAILAWLTAPSLLNTSALASSIPWLLILVGLGLLLRSDGNPGSDREPDQGTTSTTVEGPVPHTAVAPAAAPHGAARDPSALGDLTPARRFGLGRSPNITPVTLLIIGASLAAVMFGLVVDAAWIVGLVMGTIVIALILARRGVGVRFPVLGPITLLVCAALAAGLIGLGVAPGLVVGIVVCVMGAALLFGSKVGRARGLVIPAALLCVAAAPAVAGGVRADSWTVPANVQRIGVNSQPTSISAAGGTLRVDLTQLSSDSDMDLAYALGVGKIEVVVPAEMTTEVTGDVALGQLLVTQPAAALDQYQVGSAANYREFLTTVNEDPRVTPSSLQAFDRATNRPGDDQPSLLEGHSTSTVLLDQEARHLNTTLEAAPGSTTGGASGTLRLNLKVGAGEIHVIRPAWADVPPVDSIGDPFQVCTQAGGATSVVEDCNDLPEGRRVPTCLTSYLDGEDEPNMGGENSDHFNDEDAYNSDVDDAGATASVRMADAVVDCRSLDRPPVLACNDGLDRFASCTDLGIDNQTKMKVAEVSTDQRNPGIEPPGDTVPPLETRPTTTGTTTSAQPTTTTETDNATEQTEETN